MSTPLPQAPLRPAAVASASVLAIVLGGWEALRTLAALAATSTFAQMPAWLPTHELPMEERGQLARVLETMASAARIPEVLILASLTLPLALWTIVAALRLRRRKRGSARWFARAVTALAVVEVLQLLFALRMGLALQPMFDELLRAGVPDGAQLPTNVDVVELVGHLQKFLQLATIGGVVAAFVLGAAKVLACLYARHCARKADVVAWTG
jgi:hypothetical protein